MAKIWNKGDKHKTFILGETTDTFPNREENELVSKPTWKEIEGCKGDCDPIKQFEKLRTYDASENKRSFAGNKLVYEFFLSEMLKTRYKNGATLQERWEEDSDKVWESVCKMDRCKMKPPSATDVFELNRAITFFKPTIAKHLYQRYGAKKRVLDPCAGWGGRMLGAMSLDIPYVGFDTNSDIQGCYDNLKSVLGFDEGVFGKQYEVRDGSCLDADFSKIEYDMVLTSPPYFNLEVYPHMTPWKTEDDFYKGFLMKMISRAYKFCEIGGHICINMSPEMYEKIMGYGFPQCNQKVDFLQQKNTAQWGEGKGKQDLIYVWVRMAD